MTQRSKIHPVLRSVLLLSAAGLTLAGCGQELDEFAGDDGTDESAPVLSAQSKRGVIPGRFIVTLKEGMAAQQNLAIQQNSVVALGGSVHHSYDTVLRGFAATLPEAALAKLKQDPSVQSIEPDHVVTLSATQSNATWGIDRIDQRTGPLSRTYTYNQTGAGVDVFVIDTGVRVTHTDFGGHAKAGFSSVNDGKGSNDCHGHGTHVAGTIGSKTYGVAKDATIYAVRVLDCGGSGSDSGVIAGIDWVTKNKKAGRPAVANMSLGGEASAALDTALKNSVAAGVTYVVAAGNENSNACNVSPARVPEAITVGSSNSWDTRSGFSNYGTCVDIFAPGSGIRSTWGNGDTATASLSGTSMASPHVAGAAALYLQKNPSATPAQVAAGLNAAATPNRLSNIGTGSPNRLLYSLF